eukprot:jgi/Phyca11/132632/e_gw1.194.4.1
MPRTWQTKLASSGVVHDTLTELTQYFTRIEKAEAEFGHSYNNHEKREKQRNKSKGNNGNSEDSSKGKSDKTSKR